MVRPVETIRREIESLNQATVALATEFSRLYTSYLESLGIATRRQVVMATYHLCTQVYPEGFLALSVSQREKLQRDVRQLGQMANTWLQQLLDPEDSTVAKDDDERADGHASIAGATILELPPPGRALASEASPQLFSLPEMDQSMDQALEPSSNQIWMNDPQMDSQGDLDVEIEASNGQDEPLAALGNGAENLEREAAEEEVPLPALLKSMVMAALAEEMGETFSDRLFTGDDMTPTRLAKQHIFLEQRIREVLQRVSKQVNHLLQAARVIPNLPDAVLDAASETEVGPTRGRSVPNVLSVLVAMSSGMEEDLEDELEPDSREDGDEEDEDEDEPREGMMTHLAAVNLRLSDVEFADVQSSLWRSKLRTTLGKLRKLGKQYQKAQREMAIAEAEQAWRAVWYDDSDR